MTELRPPVERVFIEADEHNERSELVTDRLVACLGEVAIEVVSDLAEADAFIVLGGDGTFQKKLHKHALPDVPVAGVNIGTVGFLMDTLASREHLSAHVQKLADGEFRVQSVPTIEMEVPETSLITNAINEVVIERAAAQALNAHYRVGNAMFTSYVGDGLIFATALGSTGYAASAGGVYLDPDVQGYVMVHSNEYRSNLTDSLQKPAVISARTKVEVQMDGVDKRPYRLTRDGFDLTDWPTNGSPVLIGLSEDKFIHIIRFDDYDWGTHLREVLHPKSD